MVKIFLLGYGKMGRKIQELADSQGIDVVGYTSEKREDLKALPGYQKADGVIEFTRPESAYHGVMQALRDGKFVVCGTTGWEDQVDQVRAWVKSSGGRFFYASNFSVGANLLFGLNEALARWMRGFPEYKVHMEEVHHTEKLDKPSGTAKTLAQGIMRHHDSYQRWSLEQGRNAIQINCHRQADVKGIHEVVYTSMIDSISIRHEAFSRDGFALGALQAAFWLSGQKDGHYGMKDMLKLT